MTVLFRVNVNKNQNNKMRNCLMGFPHASCDKLNIDTYIGITDRDCWFLLGKELRYNVYLRDNDQAKVIIPHREERKAQYCCTGIRMEFLLYLILDSYISFPNTIIFSINNAIIIISHFHMNSSD